MTSKSSVSGMMTSRSVKAGKGGCVFLVWELVILLGSGCLCFSGPPLLPLQLPVIIECVC